MAAGREGDAKVVVGDRVARGGGGEALGDEQLPVGRLDRPDFREFLDLGPFHDRVPQFWPRSPRGSDGPDVLTIVVKKWLTPAGQTQPIRKYVLRCLNGVPLTSVIGACARFAGTL